MSPFFPILLVSIPERDGGDWDLFPKRVEVFTSAVSIPERDGGDWDWETILRGIGLGVSIPERDGGDWDQLLNGAR